MIADLDSLSSGCRPYNTTHCNWKLGLTKLILELLLWLWVTEVLCFWPRSLCLLTAAPVQVWQTNTVVYKWHKTTDPLCSWHSRSPGRHHRKEVQPAITEDTDAEEKSNSQPQKLQDSHTLIPFLTKIYHNSISPMPNNMGLNKLFRI